MLIKLDNYNSRTGRAKAIETILSASGNDLADTLWELTTRLKQIDSTRWYQSLDEDTTKLIPLYEQFELISQVLHYDIPSKQKIYGSITQLVTPKISFDEFAQKFSYGLSIPTPFSKKLSEDTYTSYIEKLDTLKNTLCGFMNWWAISTTNNVALKRITDNTNNILAHQTTSQQNIAQIKDYDPKKYQYT